MISISSEATPGDAIVCIPARNEAERIGHLLTSLAAQSVASASRPLKVVVVSNNSTDATASIARRFEREPRLTIKIIEVTLPPDRSHAGGARRLAMDAGADWLEAEGIGNGVLISTDADAIVPEHWVAANLAALAQADLVGGRLIIARDEEPSPALVDLNDRVDAYWAAVRALEDRLDPPEHDPAPRHGDHTGASLALRVALYRAVDGVPAIATGEDNALVAAIARAGGRVRHCPDVWVEVSAREAGRAAGGMAGEMARRRAILATGAPYLLPGADFWHGRLSRRATWRAEWPSPRGDCPNAIAHVAWRESEDGCEPVALVPIDVAIAALHAMVAKRSDKALPALAVA